MRRWPRHQGRRGPGGRQPRHLWGLLEAAHEGLEGSMMVWEIKYPDGWVEEEDEARKAYFNPFPLLATREKGAAWMHTVGRLQGYRRAKQEDSNLLMGIWSWLEERDMDYDEKCRLLQAFGEKFPQGEVALKTKGA
ncbi:hypothetical protein LCGC14_3005810 [marine sediment metagenome]|uniref:Uncharacterized protein n=1 Tax=marine sediment metagenome TaxID=412755 RepID=A0A0F8WZJ3_9ZZZZ